MILIIDNYDSFVYNLVHYFQEFGEEVMVCLNDAITIEEIRVLRPRGIVLSPGPKAPCDAGICVDIIRYFATCVPILGVCLGHQAIAYAFGAHIIKGARPMHGKLSLVTHQKQGLFKNIPSPIKAMRYHSLIVDSTTLSDDFIITAKSSDGDIMGLKHKCLLLEGIQFHPEALLTEFGHELLANYLSWCKEVETNHANAG
jgi:para-aminobenzoate synthetase component II